MYYSILFDEKKKQIEAQVEKQQLKWDKHVKRTVYQCSICQVYLCEMHFECFHTYVPSNDAEGTCDDG